MKWITREHVKVDRVACPWLISRFIDADAQFHFLPKETDWPSVIDGILFEVPGCELGHKGEDVSFDSILNKYGLSDPALRLIAEIVRAADSHPATPHPAGEGLRWIAHGFSKLHLSDHELLDREFIVYDALYAECKERSTFNENK
ncbi:MAG TPA: chromate resistance protein ChrB domain-containing protein [Edaphobacter sp.]|nr:chromate resistance protein ChrB domain-containing protein [Edaphobacter sp.]